MSRKQVLIGVEGNHDQAFLSRILRKILKFRDFKEDQKEKVVTLESIGVIWKKFVPTYPPKSENLYIRLDMPSILYTDAVSVAIYAGEGSNLQRNLVAKLSDIDYTEELDAFAIVADADKQTTDQVAKKYHDGFQEYFADFPSTVGNAGKIQESSPKLGLYILPDNVNSGVLDTLLCACGEVAYPKYMEKARDYLEKFSEEEIRHWKTFDRDKATIASVLKPGKTNTTTISDNQWISQEIADQIPELQNVISFLKELLQIE